MIQQKGDVKNMKTVLIIYKKPHFQLMKYSLKNPAEYEKRAESSVRGPALSSYEESSEDEPVVIASDTEARSCCQRNMETLSLSSSSLVADTTDGYCLR
mmetsp:Transcript_101/g.297  ORF Transcript_101/g.297 Transcript_101/m.297 type:complete len:99 (-) Transcript_101:127-423(-)